MSEAKLLKKITSKEIMGVTGKDNVAKEQWVKLAKAGGEKLFVIAGDVKTYGFKHTSYGDAYFFLGVFVARNNLTGQVFKSSKVYLPSKSDIENVLAEFKTQRESDPTAVVSFNMMYSVVEDAAQGYTFISESAQTPEHVTREAELLGAMKALPAPKKAAK